MEFCYSGSESGDLADALNRPCYYQKMSGLFFSRDKLDLNERSFMHIWFGQFTEVMSSKTATTSTIATSLHLLCLAFHRVRFPNPHHLYTPPPQEVEGCR